MQVNGYPDLLGFARRNRSTLDIRERMQEKSLEAVTGKTADITKATHGSVGDAHLLEKALSDVGRSTEINSLSRVRLNLMINGVNSASSAVGNIGTEAILAVNSGLDININSVSNSAEDSLRNVMTSLEVKHGTRNLFSGTKTDTPVFNDASVLIEDIRAIIAGAATPADAETALDTYFNDPAGGYATNIYQGSTTPPPALPIGNGNTVPMDVTGNDGAIKDVLRGLAVLAVLAVAGDFAQPSSSDDFKTLFTTAANAAARGNTGLTEMEGKLGLHAATLDKVDARLQAESISLNEAYTSLLGVDQFAAASELQILQAQLEASYTITARLSTLTLTNYLR